MTNFSYSPVGDGMEDDLQHRSHVATRSGLMKKFFALGVAVFGIGFIALGQIKTVGEPSPLEKVSRGGTSNPELVEGPNLEERTKKGVETVQSGDHISWNERQEVGEDPRYTSVVDRAKRSGHVRNAEHLSLPTMDGSVVEDSMSSSGGKPSFSPISNISFIAYNSYRDYPSILGSPWKHIAEPFRITTLEAHCPSCGEDTEYTWVLGEEEASAYGKVVNHTFKSAGMFEQVVLTITSPSTTFIAQATSPSAGSAINNLREHKVFTSKKSSIDADNSASAGPRMRGERASASSMPSSAKNGNPQADKNVDLADLVVSEDGNSITLSSNVIVKYVRREIRMLTEEDRDEYLDTMEILYRLRTEEGQKVYGYEYKGMDFFTEIHLEGAGQPECDHWHDDAGIMTHHVGYSLLFEQALQVINPAVALHYWEYTLDEYLYDSLNESPVFLDDWFGEMSPNNDLKIVTKGRWAYTPVARNMWNKVHNPWGLLRSPWNMNPTPYFTRHDRTNGVVGFFTPSCQTYSDCFYRKTISGLFNCLNGATHGPVHILVGGNWNHPDEVFMKDWGFSGKLILLTKVLWRKGYLRYPEDCTGLDENLCTAGCPTDLMAAHGMNAYDVLIDTQALYFLKDSSNGNIYSRNKQDGSNEKVYHIAGYENDPVGEAKVFERILKALCNPGYAGEMFTSSAPYDPVFWLLHPTADRFLAQRRLMGDLAGDNVRNVLYLNQTWGYLHNADAGDDGMVCDWSNVVNATDLPTCHKATCGGHNEDDVLPFKVKIGQKKVKLTNAQWYAAIHPYNSELPYMYDSFEWKHCEEQGYKLGF